jgi:hypothetical protein
LVDGGDFGQRHIMLIRSGGGFLGDDADLIGGVRWFV